MDDEIICLRMQLSGINWIKKTIIMNMYIFNILFDLDGDFQVCQWWKE